jgi:hypothetical protein
MHRQAAAAAFPPRVATLGEERFATLRAMLEEIVGRGLPPANA